MDLYRYFSISENSIRSLSDGYFWFSSYIDFNDPFECRFSFQENYEIEEEMLERLVGCILGDPMLSPENREQFESLCSQGKKTEIVKILFSIFKSSIEKSIKRNSDTDGICCFSRGSDIAGLNQLMWSHYANGLRGYCLVFDEDELNDSLIELNNLEDLYFLSVNYTNGFPIIDLSAYALHYYEIDEKIEIEHGDSLDDIFSNYAISKSEEWSYESEWRFISLRKGVHRYKKDNLKKVLIGERMSETDRRLLGSILMVSYPNVNVIEVGMSDSGYELIYKQDISIESLLNMEA